MFFLSHLRHWKGNSVPIKNYGPACDNQTKIKDIQQPVLIFHSEDDSDVPHRLGWTLYERSKLTKTNTYEHTFPSYLKLGHSNMYKNIQMKMIFKKFIVDNICSKWCTKEKKRMAFQHNDRFMGLQRASKAYHKKLAIMPIFFTLTLCAVNTRPTSQHPV